MAFFGHLVQPKVYSGSINNLLIITIEPLAETHETTLRILYIA